MEKYLRLSFQFWPTTIISGFISLVIFALLISASNSTVLFGEPMVPQQMVVLNSVIISFARIIIGSLLSFSIATLISMAIFLYCRTIAQLLMAILFLIGVTPAPIWSTLSIMSFGLNTFTPILTIVSSTLFLLAAVNINTLVRIPINRLFIADLYGLNLKKRVCLVILPEATPGFMLGIRLTLLVSWIALITAESSGVDHGLGSLLLFGRHLFDWQIVVSTWGAIIASAAITDGFVSAIAQKFFKRTGE